MADSQSNPNEVSEESAPKPKVLRKRKSWLRRFAMLFVLLVIAAWISPLIVSKTELRNHLPKLLLPQLVSQVQLGETRLDWLSPIDIRDIRIEHDSAPLFEAARFSSSEPLWRIIARTSGLGTFRVQDPVLHVSVNDTDTNVERFISKCNELFPSSGSRPSYQLEIENGRVELENATLSKQTSIDQVVLHLKSADGVLDELNFASGNPPATDAAETTDWIVVRYLKPIAQPDGATEAAPVTKTILVKAAKWKLDRFGPLLPRVNPHAELEGELNADTTISLIAAETGTEWDWSGTLGTDKLVLAGFPAIERDRLALDQVQLTGRTAMTQGRLAMHDVKVVTDIGLFTATGDVPLGASTEKSSSEIVLSLLSDEDYHVQGRVDLARLAKLLPQTLHIRDGIEITGGDVQVDMVGAAADGIRRWSGKVGIAKLNASNNGQPIPWNQPFNARFAAHRDQSSVIVDLLECQSDFLKVSAKGTLEDAEFTANGDLTALLNQIKRFVDIGVAQMAGTLNVTGELKRLDASHVALKSHAALNNFAFGLDPKKVWREQRLELNCSATAQVDSTPQISTIDAAQLQMSSGGDTLIAVLQSPVDWAAKGPYALKADVRGNLATWQTRLRPFAATSGWNLSGNADISTRFKVDLQQVDVSVLDASVTGLQATSTGWIIQDPNAKLTTAGTWNRSARTWKSQKFELASEALTAHVADMECAVGDQGVSSFSGRANYKADLSRLSRWKNQATPNPSYYLLGTLTGTANVIQQGAGASTQLDGDIQNFIVAAPGVGQSGQMEWLPLWKEPQLKLGLDGAYDASADRLAVKSSRVELTGLSLLANGTLDQLSTARRIDLTGNVDYDWDQLSTRLDPRVGQNVRLTGKDRRPFNLKGSLVSTTTPGGVQQLPATSVSFRPTGAQAGVNSATPSSGGLSDLMGQGGVGWQSASVYGFTAGAGDLSAKIERGVCQLTPLDLVVNDGKLHLAPTIYLDRNPAMVVVPQGKLVDQVTLSPELCRNALKLALPMLADSTEVDGKFSVDVQGASLPLSAPSSGAADGVISIHRAQARPGPAAAQLVSAINQIQSLITRRQAGDANGDGNSLQMPEQQIPIKLQQGRVYHQGMTFVVRNVTVKTSGSVGVDNTLSLVAEIPVKDEWIGNNKTFMGLKGKTLQVPIGGTTSRPQIDPNFLASLAQQLGGSALEGVLQDKVGGGLDNVINNGLDKLLRGKK